MGLAYPIIVVPGITATYLQDEYSVPLDYVWTVTNKQYERASLHPNDLRYELEEPARVRAGQVFDVAYKELIEELRYNLREKADEPVPVYPFGYDWRMPLDVTELQFDAFVDEVIERTKLLRHYHEAGFSENPKVNLVGHSMGGLIITGYLERKGAAARVHRVATLATPYQGSFEAVIKIATGTADLGGSAQSSRDREMARITPALYQLFPSFNGAVTAPSDIPDSLFDAGAWQPAVVESIREFVRLKGLPTETPDQDAFALFTKMLDGAKAHTERISSFTPEKAGLTEADWLAVVGVGASTRVHLEIVRRDGKPDFRLTSDDRKNQWDPEKYTPDERRLTGDGTVPFEGAIPPFLKEENLVCVSPDDYGYWELQDRVLTEVAGFHGILPNMDMLHRLLVRFFTGRPDPRGNTWGRPAPGVTDWQYPPILQPLGRKDK